jgi:hypothetical protein
MLAGLQRCLLGEDLDLPRHASKRDGQFSLVPLQSESFAHRARFSRQCRNVLYFVGAARDSVLVQVGELTGPFARQCQYGSQAILTIRE